MLVFERGWSVGGAAVGRRRPGRWARVARVRPQHSRPSSRARRQTIPKSRRPSADAGGVPGAASPPQCPATRATTTKPETRLRPNLFDGLLTPRSWRFLPLIKEVCEHTRHGVGARFSGREGIGLQGTGRKR